MTQQKAEKAICKFQQARFSSNQQAADYACRFFLFVQLTKIEMPGAHCQPNSERPKLSSLHDFRIPIPPITAVLPARRAHDW